MLNAQYPGQEEDVPRKRKDQGEDTSHKRPQPKVKKARLTTKNLRIHQQDTSSEKRSRMKQTTSETGSSSSSAIAMNISLNIRLSKNGVVFWPFDTSPPDDAEEVKKALLEDRDVPVWAHQEWETFLSRVKQMAYGEISLESTVVESMLRQHKDDAPINYVRNRRDKWTEVDNEITVGICDPKPGVTETYLWTAYPPGTREEFDDLVVTEHGYSMPTFAMETSNPDNSSREAERKAAYDGAVMTHAALAIDGCIGRDSSLRFRKTKAITIMLTESDITVYANHAIREEILGGQEIFYHQYKLLNVEYAISETEWNRAHSILYNAQNLALKLATSRIEDVKTYFEDKRIKYIKLKAELAELQRQARAQIKNIPAFSSSESTAESEGGLSPSGSSNVPSEAEFG